MALHSSDNRHLGVSPFGTVLKTGYSLELGLDQLGVFTTSGRKATAKGLMALSDFKGIDKERENLSILFGSKKDTGVKGSDKNSRTVDFTLRNVKKVGISHPKVTEQKFDYWRVGWNGIDDLTSFKFFAGQTLEFNMTIAGAAVTFFNNSEVYTVAVPISIPNIEGNGICDELGGLCDPLDCREHTLGLVKRLNEYSLPGGQVLSDYFDIYPIFSTVSNPTKVGYTKYCLEYCGFGGNHELSAVSAQYPGKNIVRDKMSGQFTMFIPTADGAPAAFKQTKASVLKGCENCPSGYSEIKGGTVYAVAIEDDGEDLTTVVQALPNAIAGTAVKTGQDYGVGHYSVVLSKDLVKADEKAFVTANPTATILSMGSTPDFCKNTAETTHAWVACGTCNVSSNKYRIVVPNDCKGSRLAELQAAYPDLTITQVSSANCISIFETTVMSDPSCDEGCNPAIVEQVFNSKAPKPFGINHYWFPVSATPSVDTGVKCGFEIKAKPIVMNASECLIEELPFVATSTRIVSISGGYPVDYSLNTMPTAQPTFSTIQLERAVDLDNLGGNLRTWEQKGRFYFQNVAPYRNVLDRALTGTQTRLEGLTQYSDAYVTIEKDNKAGINSKEYTYITYHVLVPFGRTTDVVQVLETLAGAAGVPFDGKAEVLAVG